MASKQKRVFIYKYHGKCAIAWLVTPLMRLLALICEVRFQKEEGSSWLKLTYPKIEIDQTSCNR